MNCEVSQGQGQEGDWTMTVSWRAFEIIWFTPLVFAVWFTIIKFSCIRWYLDIKVSPLHLVISVLLVYFLCQLFGCLAFSCILDMSTTQVLGSCPSDMSAIQVVGRYLVDHSSVWQIPSWYINHFFIATTTHVFAGCLHDMSTSQRQPKDTSETPQRQLRETPATPQRYPQDISWTPDQDHLQENKTQKFKKVACIGGLAKCWQTLKRGFGGCQNADIANKGGRDICHTLTIANRGGRGLFSQLLSL